ncbi:MAG: PAS domain S-box protein [Hyphomicrobiales bacterium]
MSSAPAELKNHAFLIADAASRFRTSRDWTDHISTVLMQVGVGLDLSRAYLFQVHELPDGGLGQSNRAVWLAPGETPLRSVLRGAPERILDDDETMQLWAQTRRRGEMIEGHVRNLQGHLRELFDSQGTKSFMSFPIWVNGSWWGHVGFDDTRREREWSLSEKSVLRTIAYLIGDAVELSVSSLVMSEATRMAMLVTAPDGIVVVDEAGAILEFNPAAERIFGRSQQDVFGKRISDIVVPEGDQRRFAYFLRRLQQGRAARMLGQHIEALALHADGGLVPVELAITEIRHTGRRLFVAYVRDLTERKRTEAQVAQQREALHQSEKLTALGSLLAGVAHEINNPLSVVIGRAIMLEEEAVDERQRERLGKLREAAERCAKVSKTFLAMARQSPSVREPMVLNKAVLSALDLVSYQLRSGGVVVRLDLADTLPKIVADVDQMVQVFVNLFVNAEHALRTVDERVLTVRTGVEEGGDTVVAEVRDSGPGIKPEVLPRIFEPFFTTKPAGLGTGLGLAVSFGMVAAHGGVLEAIAPDDQRGACFRIKIPATFEQSLDLAAVVDADEPAAAKRVLVVDDEPEIVSLLRDILERAGHKVDEAEHGLEALARVGSTTYDAIFCDLRMPGLDGPGLRRQLLAQHPIYRERMIFVTGDLLDRGRAVADLEGCPIIEKPFYARTVLEELAQLEK